jgi:hypothetical protein
MRALAGTMAWVPLDRRTLMALGLILVTGALAVAGFPVYAAVLCMGVWGLAAQLALPRRMATFVPVVFLASFPADHVRGLNEGTHGFFVLGATALLGTASVLRCRARNVLRTDWDLLGLASLLILTTLFHSRSGEIRGVMFWVSACLFLFWIRSEEQRGAHPRPQIEAAIVVAGALGGLMAILEWTGLLKVGEFVAAYQPARLDLVEGMGSRAVGLSGHPLRLGTLTMLSSLVGLTWITHGIHQGRYRRLVVGAVLLSLAGLALSGARGSWLGFAVGGLLILILGERSELRSRAARAAIVTVMLGALVWGTGAWEFFYERAIGSASHPASLEQRLMVLDGIRQIWVQVPFLGLGFGGASEKVMALGLKALNIENEYLRFFLAAGWLAPVSILALGARRIRASMSQLPSASAIVAVATLVSLLVNMATFNLFAWSFGPAMLFMLACLAIPSRAERDES